MMGEQSLCFVCMTHRCHCHSGLDCTINSHNILSFKVCEWICLLARVELHGFSNSPVPATMATAQLLPRQFLCVIFVCAISKPTLRYYTPVSCVINFCYNITWHPTERHNIVRQVLRRFWSPMIVLRQGMSQFCDDTVLVCPALTGIWLPQIPASPHPVLPIGCSPTTFRGCRT